MEQRERGSVAYDWWRALAQTCYVPMPARAAQQLLEGVVGSLAAALDHDSVDTAGAAAAGRMLVQAKLTDPAVVPVSARALTALAQFCGRPDVEARMAVLLACFGRGYGAALQQVQQRGRLSLEQGMDEARRAAEERFRVVFDNAAVAIAVGDTEGRLVDANRGLAEMVGLPVPRLRGASVYDFTHPEDREEIRAVISEKLVPAGEGTAKVQLRIQRTDGHCRWASFAITFVKGAGGQHDYLLAVGEDVTERHRMQDELHRQARHDLLTGLPNRRCLVEQLDTVIAQAGGAEQVGLCFLDLDGFKHVNDRYGHGVGDRLLTAVANRLREGVRAQRPLLARIGGDEFVALVASADAERVTAVAAALLAALTDPIVVGDTRVQVSASIGALVAPVAGAEAEALLDAADTALLRAKAAGKGRWVLRRHDLREGALALHLDPEQRG